MVVVHSGLELVHLCYLYELKCVLGLEVLMPPFYSTGSPAIRVTCLMDTLACS